MNERWKKTDKPVKERERERAEKNNKWERTKKAYGKRSKGGNNIFFLFGREEEGKKKRIYKRKIDRRIQRKERTQ